HAWPQRAGCTANAGAARHDGAAQRRGCGRQATPRGGRADRPRERCDAVAGTATGLGAMTVRELLSALTPDLKGERVARPADAALDVQGTGVGDDSRKA